MQDRGQFARSHSDRAGNAINNIIAIAGNLDERFRNKDTVTAQQRLIRYFVEHPEDVGMIEHYCFEGFENEIFKKLKACIESGLEFTFNGFLFELTQNERDYYKTFIDVQGNEPPTNKHNAQLLYEEVQQKEANIEGLEAIEDLMLKFKDGRDLKSSLSSIESLDERINLKNLEEIDPRKRYKETKFVFQQTGQYQNEGLIPFGNLSRVKAKIKQGKSKAADLLAGIALSKHETMTLRCNEPEIKVLLFDTEQSQAHVSARWTRIARLAEIDEKEPCERLKVFPVKMAVLESKEKARNAIIQKIKECSGDTPLLVIIDGINDLGDAELDDKAAKKIVSQFMAITENADVALVGVIHENRNNETTKGWLGLIWDEKSASLMQVKKNSGYFSLKQEDSRDGEIQDITFRLEDFLTIAPVDENELERIQRENDKVVKDKLMWRRLFDSDRTLSQKDLSNRVQKERGIKHPMATKIINDAVDLKILHKGEGRRGLYSIVPDDEPEEATLEHEGEDIQN